MLEPFNDEQTQMMNDITDLLKKKYPHLWNEYSYAKEDNTIRMEIFCSDEQIELDDDEDNDTKITVFDIDPEILEGGAVYLSEEGKQCLCENLFTDAMPLELGIHLLQCAISEDKAHNADTERYLPNGRCVSLMLCAMDDLGLLVFQPRGDMLQLLTYVFGTRVEEDKHFLDYFYSRKNTKRVIQKIENYKEAIENWLNAIKCFPETPYDSLKDSPDVPPGQMVLAVKCQHG